MTGADSRPTVLVTGGARRVGVAIAREFGAMRWRVVLTYRTSKNEADAAVAEVRRRGGEAEAHALELGDLRAVDAFASTLAKRAGARLDVLVHNASSYTPSPLEQITAERIEADFRVNAAAPLLLSRGLAPLLAGSSQKGGGAIVAMCDIHAMGEHGLPRQGFASYAMSKAALAEMVRTLARELAPSVRVNGVAPGVVAFPESGYESDPAMQEAYLKRVPLGRSGTPEDAAKTVVWLATQATYMTGQIVRLDGGRSLL